jgi:hypothetical protein
VNATCRIVEWAESEVGLASLATETGSLPSKRLDTSLDRVSRLSPQHGEGGHYARLLCRYPRSVAITLPSYGSRSGNVAVVVPVCDVTVSVMLVKVALTRTGIILSGHVKPETSTGSVDTVNVPRP